MALEIKGINETIKKLSKLTNMEYENIVDMAANTVEVDMQKEVSKFSRKAYLVRKGNARKYGSSVFIDVGLDRDEDWEEWKQLWFQQWGFHDYGLNFNGLYVDKHKMWFDKCKIQAQQVVKNDLRNWLKEEIDSQID